MTDQVTPHVPTATELLAHHNARTHTKHRLSAVFPMAAKLENVSNFDRLRFVCDHYLVAAFELGKCPTTAPICEASLEAVADENARLEIVEYYSKPSMGYKVTVEHPPRSNWWFFHFTAI